MWLSLIGSVLCVSVMFLISWATALLTLLVVLALYLIVTYRKPGKELSKMKKKTLEIIKYCKKIKINQTAKEFSLF